MRSIRVARLALFAVIVVGLAVGSALTPAPVARAQGPTDMVIEVFTPPGVSVAMRTLPTLSASVIRTFGNGNRLTWDGQVVRADGRNWMAVSALGQSGWLSPDDDQVFLADPTQITRGIDRSAIIAPFTNPMTLYTAPGRGNPVVMQLPVGTQLRVTDAPVVTDLYTWWPVSVVGGTATGWVVDTGHELQVIQPLTVYGYQVCDNFDLKRFGVPGWDSVRFAFPSFIPPAEQIECLASTRLRGDASPIVVVLTRTEDEWFSYEVLRIFEQRGGAWVVIFESSTPPNAYTTRLSLHDFAGDGRPMLLWAVRNEGTGGALDVNVLRYGPGGIEAVLSAGLYKGRLQVNPGSILLFEADYLLDEPNCCPSGVLRMAYAWQFDRFALLVNDVLPEPGAFQVRR